MRFVAVDLVDNPFRHADDNFGIPDVGNVSDRDDEEEAELEDIPTLSAFTPLVRPLILSPLNTFEDRST